MADREISMMRLACDEREIRRARQWLSDVLTVDAGLDADHVATTLVVASELVSNAIVHADSAPLIAVAARGPRVRVEVHDDSPVEPAVRPVRDEIRSIGNGMRIVDAWTDDWGVDHVPGDGKVVWFTISAGSPSG